ncbi:imidazole glycerol phosphate synthase subunit HisH [Maritalea sp. S77]|uniref:imidazole glycerol phosphate synthase subunit HisH n=1 Tax=Maritalea sp. S77 TaxID=3415125 RepID=UPI003C7BFB0D
MIVIVDYGMGNIRSLYNALDFCFADVNVTSNTEEIAAADRIILPGVGAFGDAIRAIRNLGLEEVLTHQALVVKKPILGICLGMQLFAKDSQEYGAEKGLGWIDSQVEYMKPSAQVKVPQVGWNQLKIVGSDWLFRGLPSIQNDVYFVHSLHMVCNDKTDLAATTYHGEEITAAIARDNLVATQFHPEKSQDNGIQILRNWLEREF